MKKPLSTTAFTPVELISRQQLFFACPNCGTESCRVDHLLEKQPGIEEPRSFGPWFCDRCNYGVEGQVQNGVVSLRQAPPDREKHDTIVVLELGDFYFLVKGISSGGPENFGHDEYFYNMHTCPTNVAQHIQAVIDKRDCDTDPHGCFRYVKSLPARREDFDTNGDLQEEVRERLARELLGLNENYEPLV